jgi:hypothetical protein
MKSDKAIAREGITDRARRIAQSHVTGKAE